MKPQKPRRALRLARIEVLEDRRMMAAEMETLVPATAVRVDAAALVGSAQPGVVPEAVGIVEEISAGLGVAPDPRRIAPGVEQSSAEGHRLPSIPLAPPTDGILGDMWQGLKRLGGHAWDLSKNLPLLGKIPRRIDAVREAIRYFNVDKIDVGAMKPGDVVLFCSIGAMQGAIQYVTASRFNHAAIYVGNGNIVDATDTFGVSRRPLADAMKDRLQVFVLRNADLTPEERLAVVQAAMRFVGGRYSVWSAGGGGSVQHVPGKDTHARNKMCSELVFDAYFNALGGTRITTGNLPSPGEIARSAYFSVAGRLV